MKTFSSITPAVGKKMVFAPQVIREGNRLVRIPSHQNLATSLVRRDETKAPQANRFGATAQAYIDAIKPKSVTIGTQKEAFFSGTQPMRFPSLYARIFDLKPTLPKEPRILILGPGRTYIDNPFADPDKQFSPQTIEVMAAFSDCPHADFTLVDIDEEVLRIALSNLDQYQFYCSSHSLRDQQELRPFYERLAAVLEVTTVEELLSTDPYSEQGLKAVNQDILGVERLNAFVSPYDEIDYGDRQVDIIISTISLVYAIAELKSHDQKIELCSNILRALKPNASMFVDTKAFYGIWGFNPFGFDMPPDKLRKKLNELQVELTQKMGRQVQIDHVKKEYDEILEIRVGD
jgi:hypothetical protein